jgi:uncharacterized LabA/DUF88 family protein
MKDCLILVDGTNVWVDGCKFSAHKKGITKDVMDDSEGKPEPVDYLWRIDFGSLLKHIANGHKVIMAILVDLVPPPKDSIWKIIDSQEFKVKMHKKSYVNNAEEKAADMEFFISGTEAICDYPGRAVLKLVSNNKNFVALINRARKRSWKTELWGFSTSISKELSKNVTSVELLDSVFDKIGWFEPDLQPKPPPKASKKITFVGMEK